MIETYLHPEDLESNRPLVGMQVAYTEDHTPKPKKKKCIMRIESEDDNSQIEIDDDYATPKALRKRAPALLSDNNSDSDSMKITDSLADPEPEWRGESESNRESDDGSDIYVSEKKQKVKLGNKDNRSDIQEFRTIDLAKMQKKETGKKDKRAFRKEVEERRAVTERKVC